MIVPTVAEIVAVMLERKGYLVFENHAQNYDLNLVGIRTADLSANSFNDWITAFYWFDGQWNFFAFPGTTDPGTYWREHPMNVLGTAILKPGQYRGAFKRGLHKGTQAFIQASPLTVYRDNNKDDELDLDVPTETGMDGIDLHHASGAQASTVVGKWSAGCQVLQDPVQAGFLNALGDAAAAIHGNSFTYTLLTEADFG